MKCDILLLHKHAREGDVVDGLSESRVYKAQDLDTRHQDIAQKTNTVATYISCVQIKGDRIYVYNHVKASCTSGLHILTPSCTSLIGRRSGEEKVRAVEGLAKASSFIRQCAAHKNISLIVCELYCHNRRFVSQAIMSNKHNAVNLLL